MVLRQRFKSVINVKNVKVLDAFPKVEAACQEGSPVSGAVSLLSYLIIIWLILLETSNYFDSNIIYKFLPDVDIDDKLSMNIDLTVAMPCQIIGADILDSTNQNLQVGQLQEEDTWFELDSVQRIQFDHRKNVNSYLSNSYLHIHDFMWRSKQSAFESMPARKTPLNQPYDACRIFGKIQLNKVAGNFHITMGKSVQIPRGHIHISAFISERDYNFSHRINHFSFGDPNPGIVQPLEGDEKITSEAMMLYQYFLEVVPTEIETLLSRQQTFQYSTRDQSRFINHMSGSHGMPGIFFRYDMSALKVRVLQERDSFSQFLLKLCAIVGGVHVTSGMIASLLRYLSCCSLFKL